MRLLRLALPIALLALLSACVPTPAAAPTPTDAATEAPLFATDEEALAAAEEVYREYLRVLDQAFISGKTDDLSSVASDEALESTTSAVESHVAANRTQVGVSSGRIVSLVVQDGSSFQVYACLDVSTVQVFDANGESAQIPGRTTIYPMSVTFERLQDRFSVSDESVWGGDDFCR